MAFLPGKRELARLAEVVDSDYDTLDDATAKIMAEAWDIYAGKAMWCVVARLSWQGTADWEPGLAPYMIGDDKAPWLDPQDWRDSRIVLGPFKTELEAERAKESVQGSSTTHEEFAAWVFPLALGVTPAAFFSARKADKKKLDNMDDGARARFEKALARRVEWFKLHGNTVWPPDIDEEIERCGQCGQTIGEEEGIA